MSSTQTGPFDSQTRPGSPSPGANRAAREAASSPASAPRHPPPRPDPQRPGAAVEVPVFAHVHAQARADLLQEPREGLAQVPRHGQDPRRGVLGRLRPFGLPVDRHVLDDVSEPRVRARAPAMWQTVADWCRGPPWPR